MRSRGTELPAYLKGLSVALIPYKAGELTRNIFPLKLFEYLAAGLPVVAGGLPELKRYAGTIALAEQAEDYPDLVRAAMAGDTRGSARGTGSRSRRRTPGTIG